MAAITLLTPAQIAERTQKPKGQSGRRRSEERTRIIEQYKAMLRDAQPGSGADVVLDPGEEKHLVRQNLKAAADELDKVIEFRPRKDPVRLHLRFITAEAKAAKPQRLGRPRKLQPEKQVEQPPQQELAGSQVDESAPQPEVATPRKLQKRKDRAINNTE